MGGSKKQGGGGGVIRPLWPAAAGELWKISDLKLQDGNPRAHSLEQIEQIQASMREFGWTIPVLVDENGVILAGHGRVRAARMMGYQDAPVVIAKGWTQEQKDAYTIADNKLAENSEWDTKRLRGQLRTLVASEFDEKLLGFTDEDLQKLILDEPEGKPKDAEDVHMKRCPQCGGLRRKDKIK